MADELELEELGAQLDDPELIVTLEGGIDDPDGIDTAAGATAEGDEGWDLTAPLVARTTRTKKTGAAEPVG